MNAMALGYIRNPVADFIWFVALPFVAIAIAFGFHQWLPYIATASIAVWITVPHHYATWVRSYGLSDEWKRWEMRLTAGGLFVVLTVFVGFAFVPVSIALVLLLWDHQHSVMQQHGFARIYDHKAHTGAPSTQRFDFWLSMVLYGNLLVVGPIWSELWIAELYRWHLEIPAETIAWIHRVSWTVTGAYACVYLGHVVWSLTKGYKLNPMKYVFLVASYTLWYVVSWQDSLVVYAVSHRIMHGVQYIVFVYWYLDTKGRRTGQYPRLFDRLSVARFLLLGFAYTVLFHLLTGNGIGNFGFGFWSQLQADQYLQFSPEQATGFVAATAISAAAAFHYWVDSFVWKVSDAKTQEGL